MTISQATETDIPQLHALIEMCYRGESSKKGWTSAADIVDGIRTNEEILKKEMSASGGKFLKYTDEDGKIHGCVYTLLSTGSESEKEVHIGPLCVNPIIQATGIGKQLMAAAEKLGFENGCKKASITVFTIRKELVAWYERQGYTPTGVLTPFLTGGGVGDVKIDIPLEFHNMVKLLQG